LIDDIDYGNWVMVSLAAPAQFMPDLHEPTVQVPGRTMIGHRILIVV